MLTMEAVAMAAAAAAVVGSGGSGGCRGGGSGMAWHGGKHKLLAIILEIYIAFLQYAVMQ